MKVFTVVENQIGEGEDAKFEYSMIGNVSLEQAQVMLTRVILIGAQSKAEKKE